MKKVFLMLVVLVIGLSIMSCDKADIAAKNISKGADNFEIPRKVIFYNSITDKYMFTIEGYCSINADNIDNQLEVTCKIGEDTYNKQFLGLADNIGYMVLQTEDITVDPYHYRIILRPTVLIPDFEIDIPNEENEENNPLILLTEGD